MRTRIVTTFTVLAALQSLVAQDPHPPAKPPPVREVIVIMKMARLMRYPICSIPALAAVLHAAEPMARAWRLSVFVSMRRRVSRWTTTENKAGRRPDKTGFGIRRLKFEP